MRAHLMARYITWRQSIPSRKADGNIIFPSMLCLAIILFSASPLAAECYPLQMSLYSPVQLIPKDKTICGVRLDLIWGDNNAVQGIDIGLANGADSVQGIQIGGINRGPRTSERDSWGLQIGLINGGGQTDLLGHKVGHASFTGVQAAGLGNISDEVTGIQIGLFNVAYIVNGIQISINIVPSNSAGEINGLQVAPGNMTGLLYGAQLGILNTAKGVHGIQGGALNIASSGAVKGWGVGRREWRSVGGINYAHEVAGSQIGFLNVCNTLKGIQIGLVNVVTSRFPKSGLFFFPIMNAGF